MRGIRLCDASPGEHLSRLGLECEVVVHACVPKYHHRRFVRREQERPQKDEGAGAR